MIFKFKLNSVENCLRRALLIITDILNDVNKNENEITNKTFNSIDRFISSEYMLNFEEDSSTDQTILGKLTTDKRCLYRIMNIFYNIIENSIVKSDMLISKNSINNLNRVFNSNQIKDFINNIFTVRSNDGRIEPN
jgi:hypothetical protein